MRGWLFFDKSYLNWNSQDSDSSVKILKHILDSSMFQYGIRGIRFNGIPRIEMENLVESMISGTPTQSKYEDWIVQVSKLYASGLENGRVYFDESDCCYELKTAYNKKGQLEIKGVNEKDFLNSIFFVDSTVLISDCYGQDWITNEINYEQFLNQNAKFFLVSQNNDADTLFQNILGTCRRSNAFVLIDRYVCKSTPTIKLNLVKIIEQLKCSDVEKIAMSVFTQFDGAEFANSDDAMSCILIESKGRISRKNIEVFNVSTQFHDRILFLSNGLLLSLAGFDLVGLYGHNYKRVEKDTSLVYISKIAMLANDNLFEVYQFYENNLKKMMKGIPNISKDSNRLLPSYN